MGASLLDLRLATLAVRTNDLANQRHGWCPSGKRNLQASKTSATRFMDNFKMPDNVDNDNNPTCKNAVIALPTICRTRDIGKTTIQTIKFAETIKRRRDLKVALTLPETASSENEQK